MKILAPPAATVPLTRGMVALVDPADYDEVMQAGPWFAYRTPHGRTFYARRNVLNDGRRTTEYLHRFLMGAQHVDHVNLNGLDNRRANLRLATPRLNNGNRAPRRDNTSGYKGVRLVRGGRWMARIGVGGRMRHLGYHDTAEEAAKAYDDAAVEVFGDFARLNLPAGVAR